MILSSLMSVELSRKVNILRSKTKLWGDTLIGVAAVRGPRPEAHKSNSAPALSTHPRRHPCFRTISFCHMAAFVHTTSIGRNATCGVNADCDFRMRDQQNPYADPEDDCQECSKSSHLPAKVLEAFDWWVGREQSGQAAFLAEDTQGVHLDIDLQLTRTPSATADLFKRGCKLFAAPNF